MSRPCKLTLNHPSAQLSKEVQGICLPLFEGFGINAFSYSRVFPDGSRSELWSDPDALHHTFINKKYIAQNYTPDNYNNNERYVYLMSKASQSREEMGKMYVKQLLDQREIFDHDNCFLIVNKMPELCEYFIFYTSKQFETGVNFYLNHLHQLENFSSEFKEKAAKLIQLVDTDKIVKPWRERSTNDPNIQTVSKSVNVKQETFPSLLTKREKQVAQHIIEGKTALESAILLGISKRTVESYIDNIKNKYACNTKPQLVAELIASNWYEDKVD